MKIYATKRHIRHFFILLAGILAIFILLSALLSALTRRQEAALIAENAEGKRYVKWVDFTPTAAAMKKAIALDVQSYGTDLQYDWIALVAYLGAKYGGDFSRYKEKDLTLLAEKIAAGSSMESLTENMKYYSYYLEAYGAVLREFVGLYTVEQVQPDGTTEKVQKYGLKAFFPLAKGYGYSEYDDFGVSRAYGYKRKHLGHDYMASIGVPVIAVESGVIEELGWNQYGGWRVGIRSFDDKRYYFYAHLRKDHPFAPGLAKGMTVTAGDVIGYVGRTGYSAKENVNNIRQNHLHFGMQLIFDPVQKDGVNQIWIDLYEISKLLANHKSAVEKQDKDYFRKFSFEEA